jgi:glycosyltransferase involved in cell wall biosynthesis
VHLKNDPVFDANAGEWTEPENPAALAEVAKKWADHPDLLEKMSRPAAEAAIHYSRERSAGEMLAILQGQQQPLT